MLDATSLAIEKLAQENAGSYIDACTIFAEKFGFNDFEDLIEILHPLLIQKIRQEFIDKNYIPSLKPKNSLSEFF